MFLPLIPVTPILTWPGEFTDTLSGEVHTQREAVFVWAGTSALKMTPFSLSQNILLDESIKQFFWWFLNQNCWSKAYLFDAFNVVYASVCADLSEAFSNEVEHSLCCHRDTLHDGFTLSLGDGEAQFAEDSRVERVPVVHFLRKTVRGAACIVTSERVFNNSNNINNRDDNINK